MLCFLDIRARQIDLVDDWNDLQVVIQRKIHIGKGLGFDTLRCIHHEQSAFAGRHAARDFISEINVARRVNKVQDVLPAVGRPIAKSHGVSLNGDAALPLKVHVVKDLIPPCCCHFPV